MEKIKMGIVGAGLWGETHAHIYSTYEHAEVVAVCDQNLERANAFAAKFGIKEVYQDYHEMAQKSSCDAVAIVTPDFLHADIAVAFAEAKKHMLIEKPLATTREDVYRMMDSISKNGVRAMVDLHNRWSPPFHAVKNEIATGNYGKPISAYIRLNDTKYVPTKMLAWAAKSSIIWFLGSHSLDTLSWLVDDVPEEVYCVSHKGVLQSMGVDTDDVFLSTIQYKKGTIAQMENGWVTPLGNSCINDFKFNMVLEKGKFDIDASSHNLVQMTTEDRVITPDPMVSNHIFGLYKGFTHESIRSFIDKLISGEEFLVPLEDAMRGSLTLVSILESAKERRPVKVRF